MRVWGPPSATPPRGAEVTAGWGPGGSPPANTGRVAPTNFRARRLGGAPKVHPSNLGAPRGDWGACTPKTHARSGLQSQSQGRLQRDTRGGARDRGLLRPPCLGLTSQARWEVRLVWGAPGRLRPELGARVRVEAGLSIRQRKRCARGEVWAGWEERRRRSPKRGARTLAGGGAAVGGGTPSFWAQPQRGLWTLVGRVENIRGKGMCLPPPQVGSGRARAILVKRGSGGTFRGAELLRVKELSVPAFCDPFSSERTDR